MDKICKIMGTDIVVDLIPHIQSLKSKNPELKIYVGSDSQNHKRTTTYATVLVLPNNHGGHVLFHKEIIPIVRDKFTRLWNEVEKSVNLAKTLEENNIKINFIDMDYNPDPKFFSNKVLDSAIGYVISYGYIPRHKPHAVYASIVADKICK